MTDGEATVGETGEFGLIRELAARLPQGADILLGPGDDAAVVRASDGRVVATTDLLVERRDFRRDWSSAHDIGRKAAAQNLADVAAMGARPTALLVGLAVPAELPLAWALELADGIRAECDLVGASVAGGDVSRADVVTIAITALGSLDGVEPVRRGGARLGDIVGLRGRLGWSASGLAVLSRGFRSPRALVEAHRRPDPPYAAGPEAARLGATALIDVSDGLVADLGHVAAASGVGIALRSDTFDVPAPMRDAGSALGVDPLQWVLAGGEDHAMAATFPTGTVLPEGWRVIGEVVDGEGVLVDGAPWEGPGGHVHFG